MGGVLEKRGVKNRVFHAKERIYNLQISLSELLPLSGSPLLALSSTITLSAIPSQVEITLSALLMLRKR